MLRFERWLFAQVQLNDVTRFDFCFEMFHSWICHSTTRIHCSQTVAPEWLQLPSWLLSLPHFLYTVKCMEKDCVHLTSHFFFLPSLTSRLSKNFPHVTSRLILKISSHTSSQNSFWKISLPHLRSLLGNPHLAPKVLPAVLILPQIF